jgi:hypothetical protein
MKVEGTKLDMRLADKGARQECHSCGGIKWIVDDNPAAVHAVDADGSVILDAAVEAAVMICRNCGFVRLHAVQVLFGESG